MPRVSVIIPTYNRADYLAHALQSVFDQTLAPFEIIVVDDGSTDSTSDVMRGLRERVRYYRQNHKGVSAARNLGLEVARGEVIAWLDSDDLWEPSFLATIVPLLAADSEFDGVYTGISRIDADGNLLPQPSQRVVPPSDLHSSLTEDCFIQTSTFVARKSCFDRVGDFDTQFDICEDHDMFLRLAKVFSITGVPTPLVRYRVHEHNTVANMAAFCRFRLAVTQKHFGQPEGNPQTWSPSRRRGHACAFRAAALKCIEGNQPDQGWRYLERAVSIWPALLARLDTFYELACGDQPTGYRGDAASLDIAGSGAAMLRWLDNLFVKADPTLERVRRLAYGNAYVALATLSDQAGRWAAARRYLFRAIVANPRLLTHYPVARRLLKLCAGHALADVGRLLERNLRAALGRADS